MKKKIDKLKLYNKRGASLFAVTHDGNVVWHSQNNVNKLEIIEAIHTTLENAQTSSK